ncbi:hypothetical protein NGC37_15470 [Pantoea anthophila]|uniref:hypothetical protein n=1 Tax=Pantoea anthophila TaxID=470931 RepID=UPI002DB7B675|nr:hypothetical protein [Pantoea anthophila]MEB7539702.1 hypothetical protein [Pantoea anthophila]
MRELNITEVEAVSGAGIFADIGKAIGSAIGGIVDLGTSAVGKSTDATSPAARLGSGIGSLLELNIIGAISDIGAGIVGIVEFGIDLITQFKNK